LPDTPLSKKLGIKPGYSLLILDAPDGYRTRLDPLPDGVRIGTVALPGGLFDLVQVFVRRRADVDRHAAAALAALKPGGLLWFAFPKKSAKLQTDISRDTGWDALHAAGWEIVSVIAIDDTWSAGRFRPSSAVNTRPRR
jgi:hypothetical protein